MLLRTVRMYISRIPVEISEDCNRVHAMFTECLSKDHKVMEASKGIPLQEPYMSAAAPYATGDVQKAVGFHQDVGDMLPTDRCRLQEFLPGRDRAKQNEVTMTSTLNLGALQTGMMIPLHASPITIELELFSTPAEVCQEGWTEVANPAGGQHIPAAPRSIDWEIESPRINCTLLTLSSSANQEFDKLLQTSGIIMHPNFYFVDGNGSNAHRVNKHRFSVRLTVGTKIIPEHAIENPQEALYHLLQALGLTAMRDSIACAGHQYSRTAHVMAVNLEKIRISGRRL